MIAVRRAFSYQRWSTPEQSDGTSLERQTEAAQKHGEAHGLTLVDDVYRDEGISGFRGGNRKGNGAKKPALGRFLEAVKAGEIPEGSVLAESHHK